MSEPSSLHGHSDSDQTAFRDWLTLHHGTTYGATDEQLKALLDRAQAKREALGYGSVYVMAAAWLREASAP